MLVLRRKAGEAIVLNGVITIHVLAVEGERVKLGISAPPEVVIVRSELLEGQGGLPTTPSAPVQPPVLREPTGPFREPEGEPGNGFEEGRGPRRDPNASNGTSRFRPRSSAPEGPPLPFRPNSIRYGQ
jgi:carbon storage regulator